jgi:hypothetical protein
MSTSITASSKMDYPPNLSDKEKTLLLKYDSHLKCHKPFMYHKGSDRVPGCTFPVGTSYKPLTFTTITASMPVNYKPKVTAIIPTSTSAGHSFTGHPVAVIFPGVLNPVDYVALNTSNIVEGSGDNDSDVSGCFLHPTISSIVDTVDTAVPMHTNVPGDIMTPLSVPHLFWRACAAVASLTDDKPSKFDCLIDNGSHLVLINNSLAESLSLPS